MRAGFGKIVMVVRKEFVNDFKDLILRNAMLKADIDFAFQELENIPDGLSVPPTGQNHGEPVMPCLWPDRRSQLRLQ